LFNHGVILLGGKRMSKSRGNIASPDDMSDRLGTDTARTYVLFIAPPDEPAEWNESGAEGVYRFLSRVWRWYAANLKYFSPKWKQKLDRSNSDADRRMRRRTHQTIQRVTEDIERMHFNTGISALMEMMNDFYQIEGASAPAISEAMENLALLLSPFAPHMADELWEQMGHRGSTYKQTWPTFDPTIAANDEVTVVIQVNGKVRDRLQVSAELSKEDLEKTALASDRVQTMLNGKQIHKIIVIPNKLVNIVIG
jgi:leucyl-tRNA synthetase